MRESRGASFPETSSPVWIEVIQGSDANDHIMKALPYMHRNAADVDRQSVAKHRLDEEANCLQVNPSNECLGKVLSAPVCEPLLWEREGGQVVGRKKKKD